MATDKAHGSDGGDGILGDPATAPAKAAMSPDGEPALAKEQALSDSPVRDTRDAEGKEVDNDEVVDSEAPKPREGTSGAEGKGEDGGEETQEAATAMASAEKAVVGGKLVGPNSTAVAAYTGEDAVRHPLSPEMYILDGFLEMRRLWETERIHEIENSRDKPTCRNWLKDNPVEAREPQEEVRKRLKKYH